MAFYQAQLRSNPDLWIKVHSELSLPPPDPLWPQTSIRFMFENILVEMLKGKHLQGRAAAPEEQVHIGADQRMSCDMQWALYPSSYFKRTDGRTQKRLLPL